MVKAALWCLLLILLAPLTAYSELSTFDIQEQIKARMNAAPGNKCTSITLVQTSDGKYTGTAEFSNGARIAINVTVDGSDIQYMFGQPDTVINKPDAPVTENQSASSDTAEQSIETIQGGNRVTAAVQYLKEWVVKNRQPLLIGLIILIILIFLFCVLNHHTEQKYNYSVLEDLGNILLCSAGYIIVTCGILLFYNNDRQLTFLDKHYEGVLSWISIVVIAIMLKRAQRASTGLCATPIVFYQLLVPPVTVCIMAVGLVVWVIIMVLIAVFYILRCMAIVAGLIMFVQMLAGLFGDAVRRR